MAAYKAFREPDLISDPLIEDSDFGDFEQRWRKQAIAAIDERTTDCCLRVHGQIQDLDQPFRLAGTPRFADFIKSPPFHWFCRTAEGLWVERFETVGVTTG